MRQITVRPPQQELYPSKNVIKQAVSRNMKMCEPSGPLKMYVSVV